MSDPAFGDWAGLPSLIGAGEAPEAARARWIAGLAEGLYGAVPEGPEAIAVRSEPCGAGQRLIIDLTRAGRTMQVDAWLSLPPGAGADVPLIVGLDFLGPLGLPEAAFPPDPDAIVAVPRRLGGGLGPLKPAHAGGTPHRWPLGAIHGAGFGLLLSCYGSWVPDDPEHWRGRGLASLQDADDDCGAISLWAWALMRLIDVARGEGLTGPIALAGHSRLGKAALWAAANDDRADAVFANASGCAGAAPAAHQVGETLAQLQDRFPHWLRAGAALPKGIDQHALLAALAPRPVVITSARADLWADPVGTYRALVAAAEATGTGGWPDAAEVWAEGGSVVRGPWAYGLREGEHDLTPEDWSVALPTLRAAFS